MRKFLQILRINLLSILSPEPEIEEEYIDKVVHLLKRDFDSEQQNKIIISIAIKLSLLRDENLAQMEKDYVNLLEYHNTLKSRMAIT